MRRGEDGIEEWIPQSQRLLIACSNWCQSPTSSSTSILLHIGLLTFFFLQTCLSFILHSTDMAELVLRVQPTGMPRSNAPFQHPMQPQDDTCPQKAYQHRDMPTACLQPRGNRDRARPFWPKNPRVAMRRSSRRNRHCAWCGGGRRITARVTFAARMSSAIS